MTLSMHGVEVRFGGLKALSDLDVTVEPGRITAILGPNAAGKSTLLRVMAGLQKVESGEARLDGKAIHEWSPRDRARSLSYLAQQPDVSGPFTVADVVGFGRLARGADPENRAAVTRALIATGLQSEAGRRYHHLSVGQRQRASLARGIAQLSGQRSGAGWLLLDEPFAAQDPGEAVRLIGVLDDLRRAGIGILTVVHDPATAWAVADRILLMREGRLIAQGPTADLLEPSRLESLYGVPFEMGSAGPMPRLRPGKA